MIKLPKVYEISIEMLQYNSRFCLFPARRVGALMLDPGVLEEIKGRMAIGSTVSVPVIAAQPSL